MADLTRRAAEAAAFLDRTGWADAGRVVVAGDASNRRYERLTRPDRTVAILMDAPPDKGEDIRPFVHIARFLTDSGLSAPKVFEESAKNGFLLIEDLGDDLFARLLAKDPSQENTLYEAATDVLIQLAGTQPPALNRYDANQMTNMAGLAFDWYLDAAGGAESAQARPAFATAFHALLKPLDSVRSVLIQRDYHAENLLWLPHRDGTARVGLLDFQDAMLGHPAYDLVSVLQDARRDVSPQIEAAMKDRFIKALDLPRHEFDAAYALLGVQRNLRILGVFARLCVRDGKRHYVDLIPRVWAHVHTNLSHDALAHVRNLINDALPPPTPEILDRLKAKCATYPKQ